MEAKANSIIKNEIPSVSDLILKQEFSLSDTLKDVKTELTEEFNIFDEYAYKPEMIHVEHENQNSILNENQSETQDTQAHENNIQILDLNEPTSIEGNILQYFTESNDPKATLICTSCDYQTHYTGRMRLHVLRHKAFRASAQPKIFACEDCEYVTKNKTNLKLHSRRHEKEREFDKMPEEYKIINYRKPPYQMYAKRKFLKKSEQVTELRCPDCDYKTFKTGHFRFHVMRHKTRENREKEPRVFMCEVCGYQTDRSTNLYMHMNRHKEKKKDPKFDQHDHFLFKETYKCNRCDFQAINKRQLYNHNYAKHKKSGEKPAEIKQGESFECDFCDYRSTKGHLFSAHLKSHSFILTKNDILNCPTCEFQTARRMTLRVHMAREHNSDALTMKKCELCSYETLKTGDFKKHLLFHKPPEEVQMAKCSECSFETLHKSNLYIHVKRRHRTIDELEMFRCFNCAYKARFKSQLKQHVVIHQDPNSLNMKKCLECVYEARTRENLMRHIRRRHKKANQSSMKVKSSC